MLDSKMKCFTCVFSNEKERGFNNLKITGVSYQKLAKSITHPKKLLNDHFLVSNTILEHVIETAEN